MRKTQTQTQIQTQTQTRAVPVGNELRNGLGFLFSFFSVIRVELLKRMRSMHGRMRSTYVFNPLVENQNGGGKFKKARRKFGTNTTGF